MQFIDEFITEQERSSLLSWANENLPLLLPNGPGREFRRLSDLQHIPVLNIVRERVKAQFGLEYPDPYFTDFLSFNQEGAEIHPHTDPIQDGFTQHTRINIIIQKPLSGGDQIQDGKIVVLKERMAFKIVASHVTHASTKVIGNVPRINLQFGFQEKRETI